jgi:TonB family protein
MERKNRRNLLLALVILLMALFIVVVKNQEFWFGGNENSVAEEPSPTPAPNVARPSSSANNSAPAATASALAPTAKNNSAPAPAAKKNNEVVAKTSAEPVAAGAAVVAATRTELPPMEVEVVAGNAHRRVRPGSNSVLVEIPSKTQAASAMAFKWSPAINAAEKTPISADEPESLSRTAELSYPSLGQKMKVQGSVLLQALVGADGGIRNLRVLSGNPILTSAAMEAARQWRFRPYLQNGQPTETQAKIVVNFTIKVL